MGNYGEYRLMTMASGLPLDMHSKSLASLSGYTRQTSIPELVLGLPFVNESWRGMGVASGLSPRGKGKGPDSASPYPEESSTAKKQDRKVRVVLAEDNMGDVHLVREALAHHKIESELVLCRDGEE